MIYTELQVKRLLDAASHGLATLLLNTKEYDCQFTKASLRSAIAAIDPSRVEEIDGQIIAHDARIKTMGFFAEVLLNHTNPSHTNEPTHS